MMKMRLSSVVIVSALVLTSVCNLNRTTTAPTGAPAPTQTQAALLPTDTAAAAGADTPIAPETTAEPTLAAAEAVTGTVEETPQATPDAGATAVPTDTAAAGAMPEATATGATTPTVAAATIPADATDVKYVVARGTVNVRSGPGTRYPRISRLLIRQAAPVTGVSADRNWWRIGCADGATGDCWVIGSLVSTADAIPLANTTVKFVLARGDVNMRSGPGVNFTAIGDVKAGQTAQVTGLSGDRKWWRVICPDGSTGDCWVSADLRLTRATAEPNK